MYLSTTKRHCGLGASTQQSVGEGASIGGSLVSTLTTAGVIAGPVGAAIGAGIGIVATAIEALLNSGCGNTCIVTSNWANQAESLLQQNVQEYLALPTPRPYAAQQAAIANFNSIWNYLMQECSNPSLGKAGQNCISDRQAGSCKWKKIGGTDGTAGTLCTSGANCNCWNWFIGYLYPIQNDPNVAPASAAGSVSSAVNSVASATGIPTWMLAAAGLLLLVLVVKP